MTAFEGVLVVDKPAGPTSHDIVEEVRSLTGGARVGHAGTLDPFATGVLPLCIGRATRLSRFLTTSRKGYSGVIRLGVTTDTHDPEGRVIATAPVADIDGERVRRAAREFLGPLVQKTPAYSARKLGGTPLHRLARRGVEVPPRSVPVTVHRLEILGMEGTAVRFEAETSAGTYIRSLAHDLGAALGCGAHLETLRRIASGGFRIEEARSLEEIRRAAREGTLGEIVRPLKSLDLGMPTITVTAEGRNAMRTGRPIPLREMADHPAGLAVSGAGPSPRHIRVADAEGNLLGVAVPGTDPGGSQVLHPEVVLVV